MRKLRCSPDESQGRIPVPATVVRHIGDHITNRFVTHLILLSSAKIYTRTAGYFLSQRRVEKSPHESQLLVSGVLVNLTNPDSRGISSQASPYRLPGLKRMQFVNVAQQRASLQFQRSGTP